MKHKELITLFTIFLCLSISNIVYAHDQNISNWTRFEGNPILTKNTSNFWESGGVYTPRIVHYINGTPYVHEGNYYMMYSGIKDNRPWGSIDQTGLAYSTDLINWRREPTNPVLSLGDTYYAGDLVVITVIVDNEGIFHAWYEANSNPSGLDNVIIGYANSTDCIIWTNRSQILTQGNYDDSEDLYASAVLQDEDGTWKMWYTGHNSVGQYNMMYATAPNPWGTWTKYDEHYIWKNSQNYVCPSEVWKENGTFMMTYYNPDDIIYVANSTDGINWTHIGTLFDRSNGWDSARIYWASQIYVNNLWYTYYAGSDGSDTSIGLITSYLRIPSSEITPTPEPTPTITPTVTQTLTPTPTVTSSSGGSSGSSSGSSSGGGGGSPSEPYQNVNKSYKIEKNIYLNIPTIYDFSKVEMLIYEIDINSDVNIPEIEIKVEELKNISSLTNATPLEEASYYNIWINTKRFKSATIKFKCNNILMKWNNNAWEQLDIKNSNDICKATTNNLSTIFALIYDEPKNVIKSSDYIKPTVTQKFVSNGSNIDSIKDREQNIIEKIINWISKLFGRDKE